MAVFFVIWFYERAKEKSEGAKEILNDELQSGIRDRNQEVMLHGFAVL